MIRQLPAGFALVIRGGFTPVIARLPRAWKNPAYLRARRDGEVPLAAFPAAAPPRAPRFVPELTIPDHVPADLIPGDPGSFPWN
jgi:hypothetical protein